MRRRSLSKYQFLALAVLLRCPMHPYAIRQEIIELTSRQVWPSKSTISHVLDSLWAAGYIEECRSDPHYWLKVRRGASYEITDSGYVKVRRELSTCFEVVVKSRKWLEQLDKFGE